MSGRRGRDKKVITCFGKDIHHFYRFFLAVTSTKHVDVISARVTAFVIPREKIGRKNDFKLIKRGGEIHTRKFDTVLEVAERINHSHGRDVTPRAKRVTHHFHTNYGVINHGTNSEKLLRTSSWSRDQVNDHRRGKLARRDGTHQQSLQALGIDKFRKQKKRRRFSLMPVCIFRKYPIATHHFSRHNDIISDSNVELKNFQA